MIIEFYILFEILLLLLLYFGWRDKHPIFWILSFIFSGIQIFTSYNIEYIVMIYDNSEVLTSNIVNMSFPILSYINILFLVISIVMFMWDIFNPREVER